MPQTTDGGWILDDEILTTGPYAKDGSFETPIDLEKTVEAPKKAPKVKAWDRARRID